MKGTIKIGHISCARRELAAESKYALHAVIGDVSMPIFPK